MDAPGQKVNKLDAEALNIFLVGYSLGYIVTAVIKEAQRYSDT
jgi:hypothetical protein